MGQSLPNIAAMNIHLSSIIESGKVDVPVLPETAQRVIQLTQDPDSNAEQISKVIQSDPTLGGHVMRIANSAAYTPNSNIVSIQQAISRLGMNEIGTIALSTSMSSKLFKAPGYESHIVVIWAKALATAFWSKETARAMRGNVETTFLCGLLHNIGKPIILQTIADSQVANTHALTEDELLPIYEQYEITFAKAVIEQWGLPDIVGEAITYQNNCAQAPKAKELAAKVNFGRHLAEQMLADEAMDIEPLLALPAVDIINLYPDEIASLITKEESIKTSIVALSS